MKYNPNSKENPFMQQYSSEVRSDLFFRDEARRLGWQELYDKREKNKEDPLFLLSFVRGNFFITMGEKNWELFVDGNISQEFSCLFDAISQ